MINKEGNCKLCSLREACERQALAISVSSDMEIEKFPCEQ